MDLIMMEMWYLVIYTVIMINFIIIIYLIVNLS